MLGRRKEGLCANIMFRVLEVVMFEVSQKKRRRAVGITVGFNVASVVPIWSF